MERIQTPASSEVHLSVLESRKLKGTMRMLSDKVRGWLIDDGVYEPEADGVEELTVLGAPVDSAFVDFYSHCSSATIMGDGPEELDGIVWMIRNSTWHEGHESIVNVLELPQAMIPLSPFEAGTYFYNTDTGAVWDVEYGETLLAAREQATEPDWPDFESFLVWFFAID